MKPTAATQATLNFVKPELGRDAANKYPDFRYLLGDDAWNRLPAAVKDRFAAHDGHTTTGRYTGTMTRVEATGLGRVLANLARFFDTPIVPYTGSDVNVVVNVYEKPEDRGIVWERIYNFPSRRPTMVRSTKRLDHDGNLLESLGRGLRMKLNVFEKDSALHFVSTNYVIDFLGLRLKLTNWLPPGTTHIIHNDEGGGRFRFTMYTEHPWFGEMYFQEGVFYKTEFPI